MRGNGIFNTVTQICATKVCCKLFLQGSLFVGKAGNKLPLRFYCDFTARFLSVENGNYILFGICLSFHATVFFSVQNHIYFIGFLSFHGTIFFVSVQNCNYVPLTFCRFTPRCFFSKLQLYFIWYLFVVSLHFFVCSKICAVQNNVKYNKYSLLMMNCPTKCNSQKKVVE